MSEISNCPMCGGEQEQISFYDKEVAWTCKECCFTCNTEDLPRIVAAMDAQARYNALREAVVHIYNSGYHAGHHCTVEGGYVDIHPSDMDTYHAEEVVELLAALVMEAKLRVKENREAEDEVAFNA